MLKSLDEARAAPALGRCDVVRSFVLVLAGWFPEHASVMDQRFARWLIPKCPGGSPVVTRPYRSGGMTRAAASTN